MPDKNPTVAVLDAPKAAQPVPHVPTKVGFVSLGCPKNLVDSEVMMGMLAHAGAELTRRAEDADVIVVNTCSFIASAQQESVNTILEMARHKTDGHARKLIVAGCLVERYRDEIRKNIPEVDAVVGTGELEKILAAAGVVSSPAPVTNSPFHILGHGPKAIHAKRKAASPARPGMAPSPTCPTIFTTKLPREYWRLRRTLRISRSPRVVIIPAAFALFLNCAASFARGVLSRW